MCHSQSICGVTLFCCSFSVVFADAEFSQIEEEMLLNPPGAGIASNEVIIYTRVRNKTIHSAMDKQFDRIESMMFVNTIHESDSGGLEYGDDDCD
jgi:hypothetical protein